MSNFNFLFLALEQERQRPYFVDNEFYNNIYNISTKLKYFCIVEREVTKWEKYSEEKENRQSNILYFDNLKKRLTK